jgi:hypothetical protein
LEKTPNREPSKPSKPILTPTDKTIKTGFDGFDGPCLGQIQKIEGEPDPAELSQASGVLGRAGVRLMRLEGGDAIGIWSDLDGLAIRHALRVMGSGELPVLYLDGPNVPLRYKLRRVPGEPVPARLRQEMERNSKPWNIRDRSKWRFIPWPLAAEEKAHTINPETHIWPIGEWGGTCGIGFVSNAQFGPNQPVIPRTNRETTRKWRKLDAVRDGE